MNFELITWSHYPIYFTTTVVYVFIIAENQKFWLQIHFEEKDH